MEDDTGGDEELGISIISRTPWAWLIPIARPARKIGTKTVEGYYSILKRGMIGVYLHCSEKHLRRYLVKFDFRYSNRIKLGVDTASAPTAP